MINSRTLWLRWVGANALGELLGLGATLGIGFLVFNVLGEPQTRWMSLLNYSLMVASGAIEGAIVGSFQWWALQPRFTTITTREWVGATIGGAVVAWFFGSLPFATIEMSAQPGSADPAEPALWIVLVGAAGVGLIAGAVLAFFQWRVLHRKVQRAGLWIPANMLAWALGMPVIFWGIDIIQKSFSTIGAALALASVLAFVGALVGAVHGAFLVRFRDR